MSASAQVEAVIKKSAAPVTALTVSTGYGTLSEIIPMAIGVTGTCVGIVATVYLAWRKRKIYNQEEEINRLKILSMKDSIKRDAEGGEQCED